MKANKFVDFFKTIPKNTFAPNIIISGLAGMNGLRIIEVPVVHKERVFGKPSLLGTLKMLKSSFRSLLETISFRLSIPK